MKLIVCCLVLLVATTAVWAVRPDTGMVDARMQGSVQIADPDLAQSWFSNPAALARTDGLVAVSQVPVLGKVANEVGGGFETTGTQDNKCLTWGSQVTDNPSGLGFGGGLVQAHDGRMLGAGFGVNVPGNYPLAVGLSVASRRDEAYDSGARTTIDAGVRGAVPEEIIKNVEILYGAVVRDATDQFGMSWDAGLTLRYKNRFTLGADLVDVFEQVDQEWRWGATYTTPGKGAMTLGAGRNDNDWAAGVELMLPKGLLGSKVAGKIGAAWEDHTDNSWLIGGRAIFGL
jgi:hypothetical protein